MKKSALQKHEIYNKLSELDEEELGAIGDYIDSMRQKQDRGSSIKKLALSRQKYPLGSKGYLAHCWISCLSIKGYFFFFPLISVFPQSEPSPVIYPLCDMRLYGIVGQTQSDLRSY